jgi:hypothetical protein
MPLFDACDADVGLYAKSSPSIGPRQSASCGSGIHERSRGSSG